jgi:flagellar motor switch protein FliM
MTMNVTPFDFRQPPAGAIEVQVADWLAEVCAAAPKQWPRVLPLAAVPRVGKVESVTVAAALGRLSEETIGLRLAFEGSPDGECLLVLPRPLLLAFVASALGESVTALPADRPLTPVEDALGEYLIRALLLNLLQDTWPAPPGLRLSVAGRGVPRKICPLPPNDVVLSATLDVDGPFGLQPVELLLPRSGPVRLLLRRDPAGADNRATDRSQIEALVHEMPAELSVVLGTAEVPLSRLAGLAEGDLLILGQRVTDPLTAKVAEADKFRVWPGRVGRRQAVRVESPVKP